MIDMNEKEDSLRRKRLPEGDDGRTIVSMNVEGMPWYTPGKESSGASEAGGKEFRNRRSGKASVLTKNETRYYTWGALRAALLVVGVLCLGIILFVLFCQYVWFR